MYKVLDLFCGAGGFALGFQQAGFKIICGIDIDYNAIETYSNNINCELTLNTDISELHSLDIISEIGKSNLPDIIIASPPCEPYTIANVKRKEDPLARLYDDPQGRLVLDVIRIIGDLRPKIFIIENVRGLIDDGLIEAIQYEFKLKGYNDIFFNLLQAEFYGCPSQRKRVFISNIKLNLKRKKITPEQHVINVLPKDSLFAELPNHEEIALPYKLERKVHKLKFGQSLVYFPGAPKSNKTFKNWKRLYPYDIAPTIMGNSRFIHPFEDRALTVREHALLMSYPNDFIFYGGKYSQYNQVGESVPPILSYQIANYILNYL